MPARLTAEQRRRLEAVRAVVLDVDGVLTDGVLVYGPAGEVAKRFHVRDGLALKLLQQAGLGVAVISGRRSEAVATRLRELGIPDELIHQGSSDKGRDLDRVEELLGVSDEQVAVIGDDLPDLPLLARAGFAACPADAALDVCGACHLVCSHPGGAGVVRELAELVLKVQGRWDGAVARWVAAKTAAP